MIKHFDAWGNPILGYLDMISYFKDDFSSISVLRNYAPIRYACMPEVHIILDPAYLETIAVEIAYPGEIHRNSIIVKQHTLDALRRLYKSSEASWRHHKEGSKIVFTHKAKVIHVAQAKGW
jgi:hypothetical protein